MHFVKLRLSGFKSFVDQTELHIQEGLTGVIGPNGCGKSNLLEALRWVMGETSAKSMRGSGMEDVIFAGAATRPARNFAEVTLSIDNTERRAPPAFNETDLIEITRRITRDQGSNYKYNGKDIRARDATTLFADASTGASSPALVRQGQISELINAKPKARRRVLEEAAGIAGLHARRHEATLRLNNAETNLERVVEILAQLEAREATLEREAKRAKTYRELSSKLRLAEAILLYRRWREASRDHAGAREALEKTTSDAGQAAQKAAEAARAKIELDDAIPKLREEEAIARAVHQRLMIERDSLEAREREAASAASRLEGQIRQLEQSIAREATLHADAGRMAQNIAEELAALDAMQGEDGEAFGPEVEAALEAEAEAEELLQAAESRLETLTRDVANLEAEKRSQTARAQDAQRQLARLVQEATTARAQSTALQDDLRAAEQAREEALMLLEEAQMRIAEADEAALAAEEARSEAQEAETRLRGTLGEMQGAVRALSAEAEQLARSLDKRREDGGRPILDEVRARDGAELALGAALGDELQIGEAEPGAFGWLTLPALLDAPALPAGVQPLADAIDAPQALHRRLSQTGLVAREDGFALQAALRPGQRLVSLQGDLWRWDGYAVSAEDAPSAAALRLQQQNRLEQVQAQCDEAQAALEERQQAHEAAQEALRLASEKDAQARSDRRRAEQEMTQARAEAQKAETAIGAMTGKLDSLAQVLIAREDDERSASAALEEAEAFLADLDDAASSQEAAEKARLAAQEARSALLKARGEREALERQAREIGQRRAKLLEDQANWSKRLAAADEEQAGLRERIEMAEAELEELRMAPEAIAEERAGLSEKVEQAESRRVQALEVLTESENKLREIGRIEKEAEKELSEAREGRARLEARAEAARERLAEYADRLREHVSVPPEDFIEKFEIDPDTMPVVKDLERSITQAKAEREKLGAVNLRADQELQETARERESLEKERADLDAAIAKLRAGVNELNKEGRERLLAAFEEVNRTFTQLFTHLFGGGDARLVLVESEDPLDAGLEIMCQPPGKRLSSLSLLSGGEQTLTAISLIFAVFLVNPAPICVLDEVDAPLDDANVTRFCDLLDEMTKRTKTRFLIITHHAVSMARMSRLFGVTMMEKGVSQLVSVDLQTAVDMVDA
ncbi:MAG: AAA family ATPase [Neomegalonema sp.]|nr:AAA family ATPase [Neomegalonema sp.]